MVRKIMKFFAYSLFFVLVLMYLMPKANIYYFLEHKLDEFGVIIDNENVIDKGFSLNIQNADINVKSISSAVIKDVDIKMFGLYNQVKLKDIQLSNVAASILPTKVQNVKIVYSLFNPLNVRAEANGDFGKADINFNILDMSIHVELLASKIMLKSYRSTLRNLKKSKEGVYIYDKSIKH